MKSATRPTLQPGHLDRQRGRGPSGEVEGEAEAVHGVRAQVVFAVGREGGDDPGDQVTQALDVSGENLEDLGLSIFF